MLSPPATITNLIHLDLLDSQIDDYNKKSAHPALQGTGRVKIRSWLYILSCTGARRYPPCFSSILPPVFGTSPGEKVKKVNRVNQCKGEKVKRVKRWRGEKVKRWKGEKAKRWKGEKVKRWKDEELNSEINNLSQFRCLYLPKPKYDFVVTHHRIGYKNRTPNVITQYQREISKTLRHVMLPNVPGSNLQLHHSAAGNLCFAEGILCFARQLKSYIIAVSNRMLWLHDWNIIMLCLKLPDKRIQLSNKK